MIEIENQCVGCETCTLGSGCSLLHVQCIYCDECGSDEAKYHIENMDYCEECANKYLDELFHDISSVEEKAELLDLNCNRID